jgi:recombination protein RecA
VAKEETPKKKDLKSVAQAFNTHMNHQYQKAVSYVPDKDKIPSVSVSKWLTLSKAMADGLELPGLPFGVITHVYGKPDTGKTSLLMEGIAAAQKQNILPILILTEHKFDFHRLQDFMGADPEQMLVLHAESIEEAYGFMEKILNDLAGNKLVIEQEGDDIEIDLAGQDCYIFMDSIGNTMSDSELGYEVEEHDKSMGKAAKALKTLTKRVNRLMGRVRDRIGILLLNQSYMSMPSYGPSVETPYGGDGIIYSCALNIRFRRVGDVDMTIKGKDVIIGRKIRMEVKKNHISHLMPIAELYVVGEGFIKAEKDALDKYKKSVR